jgi:hypothetical protein
VDLCSNNQQAGQARRWVALPYGFVSHHGRNLRFSTSNADLTESFPGHPGKHQYGDTENNQGYYN